MARFRRARKAYRYAGKARRYGGSIGGKFGGIIPPVLGGLADSFINPKSPINGVGSAAIGWFMKSNTTRDIGLYQVGASLAQYIPGIGGSSGNNGGWL